MTSDPNAELAPCPVCGGEAWIDHIDNFGYPDFADVWLALCDNGCTEEPQVYHTRAEAVAAWNAAAQERPKGE